jgi:ABC-type lipoprotein export system ATPase subunit
MSDVVLRAERLSKWFQMGRENLHVLQDCSLEVVRGQFVTVMGKSGSGKSTLMHVLGALDTPQKGQVYVGGQEVFAPEQRRRLGTSLANILFPSIERRRIELRKTRFGFVFQFYHLLPELSVIENVVLPAMISRRGDRSRAEALLERVGLAERLKHLPNELSGGERQRVAIARALVHEPIILFADEPTGNLDAENGATIMQLLHELHRGGQTIVMVTHDESIADQTDVVYSLAEGQLQRVEGLGVRG